MLAMPERIESKRLALRRPRMDDADAVFVGYARVRPEDKGASAPKLG